MKAFYIIYLTNIRNAMGPGSRSNILSDAEFDTIRQGQLIAMPPVDFD